MGRRRLAHEPRLASFVRIVQTVSRIVSFLARREEGVRDDDDHSEQ